MKTLVVIFLALLMASWAYAEEIEEWVEELTLEFNPKVIECYLVSVEWGGRKLARIPCDRFREMTKKELIDLATFATLVKTFGIGFSEDDHVALLEQFIPERYWNRPLKGE